jgi:S-adenosylmethionine/arginine decarboxylase-like enzyme
MIRTRTAEIHADVSDPVAVWHRFLKLVNALPGVTVLASIQHQFPGGGMTGLVVIAESHAAIHTWPEHGYAWAELATCGDPAALDRFAELIGVWGESFPSLSVPKPLSING